MTILCSSVRLCSAEMNFVDTDFIDSSQLCLILIQFICFITVFKKAYTFFYEFDIKVDI